MGFALTHTHTRDAEERERAVAVREGVADAVIAPEEDATQSLSPSLSFGTPEENGTLTHSLTFSL